MAPIGGRRARRSIFAAAALAGTTLLTGCVETLSAAASPACAELLTARLGGENARPRVGAAEGFAARHSHPSGGALLYAPTWTDSPANAAWFLQQVAELRPTKLFIGEGVPVPASVSLFAAANDFPIQTLPSSLMAGGTVGDAPLSRDMAALYALRSSLAKGERAIAVDAPTDFLRRRDALPCVLGNSSQPQSMF